MAVVRNPFGAPVESDKRKLKKFLFAVTKEMGLYNPYNTDTLVKTYNYCREEMGDEFNYYLDTVRKYIRLQEPSKEDGKVAINYLTDVFTKFAQIKAQLMREGKWHSNMPDGWGIDEFGLPCHADYRLIGQCGAEYTYVHCDVENQLPPLKVIYNSNSKTITRIENLKTREVIWSGKSTGQSRK